MKTGHIETAYRVLPLISSIFEYAVAEEICEHSPCQGLSETLSARPTRHHASITDPKQVGELLKAIDGYGGTFRSRALFASLRFCLFALASCAKPIDRNSILMAFTLNGASLHRE